MTQFNYCKTTFCRHLLFLVLALSFGFTAQAKDNSITLPPTSPHFGPSQINVIFDHYTPGSRERVRINLYNGAFRGGPYDTKLRKNADGTQGFAITENLVLPTQADLKIGKRAIPIIMVPEGKLTITLDSANVKFDGDYAALCTELQTVKDNLETSGRTFFDDIRGMTPLQYKQFIVDTYQANKKAIDKAAVSKACKTYARVQLDINYIGHLLGYKTYLSMSNMISKDSTAQKNLETPIDSASFFKGLAQMSILRSVNQRYYPYYCELDNKPLGIHIINDELSDNLIKANKYGKKLTSSNPFMPAPNTPLSEEELQAAKTEITCQPVLQLLLAKNEQVAQKAKADAEASKKLREEAAAKGMLNKKAYIIFIDFFFLVVIILPDIRRCFLCRAKRPLPQHLSKFIFRIHIK